MTLPTSIGRINRLIADEVLAKDRPKPGLKHLVFDYRVGPPWKWVHFEIVVDKSHALGYRKVDECERGQAANNGRRTHQRESIPSKRTRENEIGNRAVTKRA